MRTLIRETRKDFHRLHRRYSFIFTEKQEPSLHEEVRGFLRLWLLDKNSQPEIVAVNQRLKYSYQKMLKELELQRNYKTLRARFADEKWIGVYLDLTEQQFWLDPFEGVRYALPFMIAAAIYRRSALQEITDIGQFFEPKMEVPAIEWWKCAVQSLAYKGIRKKGLRLSTSNERTNMQEPWGVFLDSGQTQTN